MSVSGHPNLQGAKSQTQSGRPAVANMTKVEMLEREIAELAPEELAIFREWFAAFDAKAWDRQLEADAEAGKLNAVAESALSEYRAGKTRPL